MPEACCAIIVDGFDHYHEGFKAITRQARARFEQRAWASCQRAAVERLDLYRTVVDATVSRLRHHRGECEASKSEWVEVKRCFSAAVAQRGDAEIAETFFNSVSRRLFGTVGVDAGTQYVDSDFEGPSLFLVSDIYRGYGPTEMGHKIVDLVRRVLADTELAPLFSDLEGDARRVAERIDEHLRAMDCRFIDSTEVMRPLFYRNKGAYLVGRLRCGSRIIALALPLLHDERGVYVDAVLLEPNEVSIVFSFTRSYFFVDAESPRDVIGFLRSIMPFKPLNELYNSIGFNKHGKTMLYRDLIRHLERSDDMFSMARGERGMVMIVFTLPSYDYVFKVIKDRFAEPKTTTRRAVMEKYHLVATHDRAGRLVDAQQFERLDLDRERFEADVIDELQSNAGYSVHFEPDQVVCDLVYTERRVVPLNIYLQEAPREAAIDAVIDYGNAIKDLVMANIFPGDLLMKNFGVTRNGRVVFYDYDEICLITDCNFRPLPQTDNIQDELSAEPWYSVAENDIFPEELRFFLGLQGELREIYDRVHGDLFDPQWWINIQNRLRSGWIADIYPYKSSRRLQGELTTA